MECLINFWRGVVYFLFAVFPYAERGFFCLCLALHFLNNAACAVQFGMSNEFLCDFVALYGNERTCDILRDCLQRVFDITHRAFLGKLFDIVRHVDKIFVSAAERAAACIIVESTCQADIVFML